MGAVFLSSPPSRSSPAGQRLPRNIRNLFRSPPEYLCALEPPSVSPATSAPLYFHHDASCERPCVARPSFGSTAGFVCFLFESESSSGFHFAPEHIYIVFHHIGCLCLVLGPSGHPSSIRIPSEVPHCVGDPPFGCASAFLSLPSRHFPRRSSCPSAPFELCRPLCVSPI